MNLAGSIPKSYLGTNFTQAKWIAEGSAKVPDTEGGSDKKEKKDDKELEDSVKKEPKDNIQFVELERAKGSKSGLGTLFE